MNAASRALRILKAPSSLMVSQTRNVHPRWGHVIPLPPSVKIPFVEKIILGGLMLCGGVSIPVYVMYNLEYYKTGGARTEPSAEATRELDMKTETLLEQADQNEVAHGRKWHDLN